MEKSQRTVIIAGGGVTGLALANMLERLGINYILLESRNEIAPQIGASIGLQANGLRILDQLGCAEGILSLFDGPLVENPLQDRFVRYPDGSIIRHFRNIQTQLKKRHGYPTIFIDRQMLLQVLYEKLESKDSVYTGEAVRSVVELEDGIKVITAKGKEFKGDILVGADGIFGTVRREMWRIANKASPGYFPDNEWSRVPCHYKCIFGISRPIEQLPKGAHPIYNDKFSYLLLSGPGGKFYWFFFVKLPVPLYGNDIPRYTKLDEEQLVAEHASDPITPEVTFGQLTNSTLTALHEWVFEKWHYKRIITIGDAAHKFEPLTGHGGNSAIETAASLVNHLTGEYSKWSVKNIESAFAAVQKERFDRVKWLIDDAHQIQQIQAMADPLLAVIGPPRARLLSEITFLGGSKLVGAMRVNGIPLPPREHTVPFNDELPAKPLSWSWLPIAVGAFSQVALLQLASEMLVPLQKPNTFGGEPLAKHYTGIETLHKILATSVAIFGVSLESGTSTRLQLISFTPLSMSTILDWTLESHRVGSNGLITSLQGSTEEFTSRHQSITNTAQHSSSVFIIIFQVAAVGRIVPIYHLISACEHILWGSIDTITDRSIDGEVVKSFIPGIIFGYIIPTALMLGPFEDKTAWQKVIALWQGVPLYVVLFTTVLSTALRKHRVRNASNPPESEISKKNQNPDKRESDTHSLLRCVYIAGTATTALIHLYVLCRISRTSNLRLSDVFGSIGASDISPSEPADKICTFWQRDMLLNAASVLVNSVYRILDLRFLGYITNKEALTTSVAVLISQPVFGPAAAHIGFLGWREEVYMRVRRRISANREINVLYF
ncbi:uncharacterized protein FFB20_03024 [Fusarium fujikuroi]|uniref:FAD-binding domain-containing protein n=1 Tax=Gibberella fujikuroi (strain CBS 195.34 / IMI 58289 / NRRL A-6831) TaxID=1279085 RepID=S0DQ70_GIBF5|nr:uncharacterized protein FFUJ_05323 [Fusarium fujikuroi IMI 58289]QGI59815.1 hypothetical protein CEK27_003786 [Fusarium fujikuroi]QGI77015.1 hypothetical protein CEK25_003744 [Fusarium fujikuroi]QGI90728.1 hypothetical protein CEK26_003797 [Fusarium fujikuroi]CCT63537.1 uncharacterized protein FFUJ_05323 [Fusarium fujikuroi IMI 58289]SCN68378.1 uncharacterized protein FFB20_03024 [Fusarium fujikuroi]